MFLRLLSPLPLVSLHSLLIPFTFPLALPLPPCAAAPLSPIICFLHLSLSLFPALFCPFPLLFLYSLPSSLPHFLHSLPPFLFLSTCCHFPSQVSCRPSLFHLLNVSSRVFTAADSPTAAAPPCSCSSLQLLPRRNGIKIYYPRPPTVVRYRVQVLPVVKINRGFPRQNAQIKCVDGSTSAVHASYASKCADNNNRGLPFLLLRD